ncbi:MAG TPA: hypothetical protein VE915_09540 [Actinomycetota bacterium]|jgi:hypothetical protein|nr:hypothetical protein [Actinomycetota bacterium]
MPKRYRVVGGSKFKWEYSLEDDKDKTKPGDLLAESVERFDTEDEAEKAIREMSNKDIRRGRDDRPPPRRPAG